MNDRTTLSMADLAAYRGQGRDGKRQGTKRRYFCPIHGSDQQKSLEVDPNNGRFKCFSCGAWGYLEEYQEERRQSWSNETRDTAKLQRNHRRTTTSTPRFTPIPKRPEPKMNTELAVKLERLQREILCDNTPNIYGRKYLEHRKIPLDLAIKYGVGYAAPGEWPHYNDSGKPVRQWQWGRLVFPHTNPAGEVVNLYGRAIGSGDKVPKIERHDHLPGLKGIFNAPALLQDTCYITEGVFDALSLIAAGYENTAAIFGVDGMRWDWVKAKRICLCLDNDSTGQQAWRDIANAGVMKGKEVYFLPSQVFNGHKDLNELWVALGEIAAGLTESTAPKWDELTAERLTAELWTLIPDTAILWAMQYRPDLYIPLERAEMALQDAKKNKDREVLEQAIPAYRGAVEAIIEAVGDNKDILDPPSVVEY